MMMSMIMKSLSRSNYGDNPDFVHIFKVTSHDHYKPMFLKSIEEMIEKNNIGLNEKGYYYDFNIPKAPRTYATLMDQLLYPYAVELGEMYGLVPSLKYKKYWFQQYFQNSDFGWHQHNGHWACVYYLELPEITESTEFLNYGQFNVEEGDIIFFPTFLVHRSPKIISNQRKTIIATNLDFNVDRKMIENYGEKSFKH